MDLVKGGFVEEVAEQPYVCSPLSVVENSAGKKWLGFTDRNYVI